MCYSGIEPDPFHVEVQQWQSQGQPGQLWQLSAYVFSLCGILLDIDRVMGAHSDIVNSNQ